MLNHFTVIGEKEKMQRRTIWIFFISAFPFRTSLSLSLLLHRSLVASIDRSPRNLNAETNLPVSDGVMVFLFSSRCKHHTAIHHRDKYVFSR